MEFVVPVIAILCTFGVGPAIMYLRGRYKLEERRLELEARSGGSSSETKRLAEENKLLRERVENLESIVCSVDFELNQKLAKVIDDQRSLMLSPPSPPSDSKPGLDRTATAMSIGGKPNPPAAAFEPGQVIA